VVPLQQPFGHEVALQTQVPLLVEQVVPVAHDAQAAPDFPHWLMVWLANGTQAVPLQHPFWQEDALQTQAPFAQVWPVAQELHAAPPVPQVCVLEVWQRPFLSQHPFGQEDALQTQAPFVQAWPLAHGAHFAPAVPQVWIDGGEWHCLLSSQHPLGQDELLQTQAPFEHALPVAHAVQAAPPVPQVWTPESWQTPFLSQQPFGHDAASQTHAPCALHDCFAAHGTHAAPFAPHAVGDAVVHWPFAQQPAQLMLPQLQAPAAQVWPDAHMPHDLPPEPQTVVDCADCATQCPVESQQPFGQEAGVQTQVPDGPHACPEAHDPQPAPAVPHAFVDWAAYIKQLPFVWQQPFGHDAGVQTHLPVASQVCPVAQAAQALPWLPQA